MGVLIMTENSVARLAAARLEVVASYLASNTSVTVFTEVFNKTDIFKALRKRHGPIQAEKLDSWADLCMGVME